MDKLTTMLLTGAAMGALSAAPAAAHGHVPPTQGSGHQLGTVKSVGLAIKTGHGVVYLPGGPHFKTIGTPKTHHYTYTETLANFSSGGARSTWYKTTHDLPGTLWYSETCVYGTDSVTCKVYDTPGQKAKASKDANAKIGVATSKENYTFNYTTTYGFKEHFSTNFTFYGPAYKLENNTVSSDNFQFNDLVKFTTSYTGSCGKVKNEYKETARLNFAMKFD